MYYVYVIQSVLSGLYYVGCTDNIERRLSEHNNGLTKYTRKKGPWVIKYTEEYVSLSDARRRESQIKAWKSRRSIEKLWNRRHRLAA